MTATDSHTLTKRELTNAQWLPVEAIEPNPFQYRTLFSEAEMQEMADSIKAVGVLQPITVRPVKNKKSQGILYQLVSGERRWRGAIAAGLKEIPAIVKPMSDRKALTEALIENLQREQPDDWGVANGLKNLKAMSAADGEEMSWAELSKATGKSIGYLRNRLELFKLRPQLQEVAQRHNDVKLALVEIQRINPITPEAAAAEQECIALIDAGEGLAKIKSKVEEHLQKEKWQRESWTVDKDSRRAQAEQARRSREAKGEVETALQDIEGRIAHLSSWAGYLSAEDKSRLQIKARRLAKSLGQVL